MAHSSRTAAGSTASPTAISGRAWRVALSSGILVGAVSCASSQHRIVETAPDCRATNASASFLQVTIKDDTGVPLPGIHVRAEHPPDGAGDQTVDTDNMGRASLCLLDGGRWRIDVFGTGFTSLENAMTVTSGVSCTTSYTLHARQPSLP